MNSSLINFCISENLPFIPVFYRFKEDPENKGYFKKERIIQTEVTGWKTWDIEKCVDFFNKNKADTIEISIKNKFIIFDGDTKEAHEHIRKALYKKLSDEDRKLYCDNWLSRSSSYYLNTDKKPIKNFNDKYHFWLKCTDKFECLKQTQDVDIKGLDILVDNVFENLETTLGETSEPLTINKKILKRVSKNYYNKFFKQTLEPIIKPSILSEQNINKSKKYQEIEKYLNLLDESYSSNYNKWISIKFVLYNELGDEGLELFHDFSKKCISKYSKTNTTKIYYQNDKARSDEKKLKIGSLIKWVQESNEYGYNELVKNLNQEKNIEKNEVKIWYNLQKAKFEENHFVLMSSAEIVTEPDNVMDTFFYHSYSKMKDLCADIILKTQKVTNNGERKEIKNVFFDMWKEDPEKRKYKHIIFRPDLGKFDQGYYNRFNGFFHDSELIETNLNPIVKTMFNHIFSNDTDYIFSWLSHIINKPHQKTNHAIVLYSEGKGVGKNTIIELCVKLFNKYFGRMSTIDDVSRNFNTHLCNKLFIYGDEIKPSRNKDLSDELKNYITTTKVNEERKNIDVTVINDYANYIFTTNNELAFNVEHGDRRYYMVECPNKLLDKKIYDDYYKIINDDNEMKKIFSFFKNYKSEKYLDIKNDPVPMTEYKSRVISQKIPGYIHFWYTNPYCPQGCTISSTKLYDIVRDYSYSKKVTSAFTPTLFGLEMQKLGFTKKRSAKGNVYVIPNLQDRKILLKNANPNIYKDLQTEDLNDSIEYNDEDENIENSLDV